MRQIIGLLLMLPLCVLGCWGLFAIFREMFRTYPGRTVGLIIITVLAFIGIFLLRG